MSAPVPYFDVIRHMSNAFDYRLRLATHAHQHGVKATARAFFTPVRTVRKWLRHYRDHGLKGLQAHSRAPRHQPHQTSAEVERQRGELRRQLPAFGSRRLIHEFDLPLSHGALERIWPTHGLIHRRRKKYQRKQDLAALKATGRLFQPISADTKDLNDIPHYWSRAQAADLPSV